MTRHCVAAFDRAAFDRDGYWVWDGIMLESCRQRLTEALKRVQTLGDEMVMQDWDSVDYGALGLTPPTRSYTPEQKLQRFVLAGNAGDVRRVRNSVCAGIEPVDEAAMKRAHTFRHFHIIYAALLRSFSPIHTGNPLELGMAVDTYCME
jgi:hypothetical protein